LFKKFLGWVALLLAQCGTPAYACPLFVEFFPDPIDVPDVEGEYVEIRLDELSAEMSKPDTLWVQFESKTPLAFAYPVGERLVLVHDSVQCPVAADVSCGLLKNLSLPNSRESVWKLWAGECRDSINLPRPKAGKALKRVKESDRWEVAELLEETENQPVNPRLYISEVHHCPLEPEPEWVEIYNGSDRAIPMQPFSFCNRGKNWMSGKRTQDSIGPFEAIVFTRDTLLLREFLGFRDVRLVQHPMGYLNNTAGSIAICMGDSVIDSVSWDKSTVACPSGFSPLTGRAENTPGFLGGGNRASVRKKGAIEPVLYKLSSRVVRRNGNPLRIYVESEYAVQLRLLDSAGHEQWKKMVPASSNAWWTVPVVPKLRLGVAFLSISAGDYETRIGILLRP